MTPQRLSKNYVKKILANYMKLCYNYQNNWDNKQIKQRLKEFKIRSFTENYGFLQYIKFESSPREKVNQVKLSQNRQRIKKMRILLGVSIFK